MTDHPATFRGRTEGDERIDWDDHATIHLREEGSSVLDGFKTIHSGTFAQMVAMLAHMSAERRNQYVIEKAGDRVYGAAEAVELAGRPDFPG